MGDRKPFLAEGGDDSSPKSVGKGRDSADSRAGGGEEGCRSVNPQWLSGDGLSLKLLRNLSIGQVGPACEQAPWRCGNDCPCKLDETAGLDGYGSELFEDDEAQAALKAKKKQKWEFLLCHLQKIPVLDGLRKTQTFPGRPAKNMSANRAAYPGGLKEPLRRSKPDHPESSQPGYPKDSVVARSVGSH